MNDKIKSLVDKGYGVEFSYDIGGYYCTVFLDQTTETVVTQSGHYPEEALDACIKEL